jgi:membrane protease subunit (stomatin/prohibitin family)
MFGRRLLGAAVVGGVAYHAGKVRQGNADVNASQQQQIDQMQQQQQQPAPQAPQADSGSTEDKMAQLQQLKQLLDSGVLTQAEFDAQKQKILQSM